MKLIRWNNDPVYPDFFNRFFNEEYDNLFGKKNCGNVPAANVVEKDDAFEIEFAVPGMNKEDFKVDVENGLLTVSSEKESVKEEKEKNYARREFVYGCFSRSFTLPKSVDIDKIDGHYENGILKINLPKREEAKTTLSKNVSIS